MDMTKEDVKLCAAILRLHPRLYNATNPMEARTRRARLDALCRDVWVRDNTPASLVQWVLDARLLAHRAKGTSWPAAVLAHSGSRVDPIRLAHLARTRLAELGPKCEAPYDGTTTPFPPWARVALMAEDEGRAGRKARKQKETAPAS